MNRSRFLTGLLVLGALTAPLTSATNAQTLTADVTQVSAVSGGTQTFTLDATAAHASESYLLLGSMTGTVPGQAAGTFLLPLNSDAYFLSTLLGPNTPPLQSSFGVLSPATPGPGGTATAAFTLPPGLGPSIVGLTLHHAFVTIDPATSGITSVSNAVAVSLVASPIGMVQIPGGSFVMGDHQGVGYSHELPLHTVTLNSFYMDVYETTNQAYVDYLNSALSQGLIKVANGAVLQVGGAGRLYCYTTSSYFPSLIGWNGTSFSVDASKLDHPMSTVTWYGAVAFANWRSAQDGLTACYDPSTWSCNFTANGYRLPTEAEWEYAARGGTHSPYVAYPWGNTIDGSHANYWGSGDPFEWVSGFPQSTPVGYYDGGQTPSGTDMANGYGLYDMSGNMWEWCGDWYDGTYYSSSPSSNPQGPSSGQYLPFYRVLRGGSWTVSATYAVFMRSANRGSSTPGSLGDDYGFRLARITAK